MGTSPLNSGPTDRPPLLPAWAQGGPGPAPDEPSPPPPAPDGQDPAAQPSPVLPTEPKDSDPPPAADGKLAQPRAARGAWSLARRAMRDRKSTRLNSSHLGIS